jgi:hypothetical protein
MRTFLALALLSFTACASAAEPLRLKMYDLPLYEEPSPYAGLDLSPAQLQAAQELELAQYRFMTWANYEYPQRLRTIDADIQFAQEELASWQRRQAEFKHFNVWSRGGNPLFLQSEDAQLTIVGIQQRLGLLQAQRGQLVQSQAIEYRQRQMELERARLNLRLAK